MSARLPVNMDATAPGLNAAEPVPTVGKVGRAYRVRSMAAKLALVPTILVMVFCFYGSVTWTVYISMTR
jgi:hypothetical protein